jgi:hypothetical protein
LNIQKYIQLASQVKKGQKMCCALHDVSKIISVFCLHIPYIVCIFCFYSYCSPRDVLKTTLQIKSKPFTSQDPWASALEGSTHLQQPVARLSLPQPWHLAGSVPTPVPAVCTEESGLCT